MDSVPPLKAPSFIMASYSGRSFRFAHLDTTGSPGAGDKAFSSAMINSIF